MTLPTCRRVHLATALIAAALPAIASTTWAGTKYFDATAGAGNGVGGSGTLAAQTTALYSNSSTGDATLSAAAATDDGIFAGTAGTVTFSAAYTLNSATFNTTNYVLTPSSTTARIFTAPITLAGGINLNLIEAAQTGDRTLGIGSVSGTTTSTLTIQGAETGTASARINLAVAGSTISVPTTISGTGTSLAGYVALSTGENITNTITNNSMFTTLLGATSGNDLTLSSAAIVSGTTGLQFSAGSSGGSGLVTINSANTYTGATTVNNGTSGIIRLGVNNALPTGTALQFGVGSNNTGALDLNGHSQMVGSLAVTGTGTINGIVNTSANSAALIISGSTNSTYSSTIGTPTTAVTGANNNISLTLAAANTGTLTLTGANTYTGVTQVNGGTLLVSTGSINGSSSVQVTGTGALTLGNATALSDAGTLNLVSGTTLNLNAAGGSEVIGSLILDNVSEPAGTYTVAQLTGFDSEIMFNSPSGETLTVVPEPGTVLGGVFTVGLLGLGLHRRLRAA